MSDHSLAKAAAKIRDAFTYDPGHSDLDDEQPIHIHVTLGDWRALNYALNAEPRDIAKELIQGVEEVAEYVKGSRGGPSQPSWRLVKSLELPEGPPVDPGRTIYCFYGAPEDCHWEYDLPDVPTATSSGFTKHPSCESECQAAKHGRLRCTSFCQWLPQKT